jgi:hypothetical protein
MEASARGWLFGEAANHLQEAQAVILLIIKLQRDQQNTLMLVFSSGVSGTGACREEILMAGCRSSRQPARSAHDSSRRQRFLFGFLDFLVFALLPFSHDRSPWVEEFAW